MDVIKIAGILLVSISILLILISLLRKNESFFNLRHIIGTHLSLFKSCKSQYFVFYGLPLLFSVGLAMIYEAGETFYSNLSVIVSILISMLLAVLSILTGREYGLISDSGLRDRARRVVSETITAIIFDAVLCVFLLLYGLVMVIIDGVNFDADIITRVFAGVSYYIFTVILLNLLLIIKRMSKIIEVALESRADKK